MNKIKRNCPNCNREIFHNGKYAVQNKNRAMNKNILCQSCAQKKNPNYYWKGKNRSEETIVKISNKQKGRILSNEIRKNMSIGQKISWKNPETRKKYYDALSKTKWIKVRSDKGQLELLNKWSRLGFNFEPNYQIHTNEDLFYVDGYDKNKKVVLEYDSKYHRRQKQRDIIRQQIIISILKPKKFWRYDAISKTWNNVLEGNCDEKI